MKIAKQSNFVENQIDIDDDERRHSLEHSVDSDLSNLFLAMQGRIRFGTGTDGDRGENISGEFQVYTSNAVADTEDTIAHGLGSVPIGYIVLKQDKASSVYDSGTTWTSTNIYLKQSGQSVATTIFLLK